MGRAAQDVVFVDGVRTPFGKAGSAFAETRADDLVVKVFRELLRRNPDLPAERIDDVAVAATTQMGDQGLTIGRTAALLAGLPQSVPGYSVDRMCAGAMTAVTTLSSAIMAGAYDVALAGGVENMSRHPMGEGMDPNPRFLAERIVDLDALSMGDTAENLHDRFPHLTKERADAFALGSQQKTAARLRRRAGSSPTSSRRHALGRAGLGPADRPTRRRARAPPWRASPGSRPRSARTAASPRATARASTTAPPRALLAAETVADELGLQKKMRMVGFAFAGVEPEVMGVGPVPSTEKALARAGLTIDDIDLFEVNEAFAVQVLAFLDHFGIADDDPRVNPMGGAIAVGHPLASSGIRLMTYLARDFERNPRRATASPPCASASAWAARSSGRTSTTQGARHERRHATTRSDEVVTHARVRVLDLPAGAGTMALITLDNDRDHTRPSTFGPAGWPRSTPRSTQVAAMPDIAAVARHRQAVHLRRRRRPVRRSARSTDAARSSGSSPSSATTSFRRLGEMAVPTFAFVNGAAMGGGIELALHCDYRTMSTGAAAMSLPEVFLGLIPGWGGAWLLPNLIGPANALEVIIANPLQQNKQLKPKDALRLGIVDVLFEPADFLEQSIRWAAGVVTGDVVVDRPEPSTATAGTASSTSPSAMLDDRIHGATPAPYRALDLVRGGQDRDARRGLRRRGRRPRRPRHGRRPARLPLRLRPRAEARQAAGRRARQVARPPGHQGRRRRRRPDGQPARAAVRPAPRRCPSS